MMLQAQRLGGSRAFLVLNVRNGPFLEVTPSCQGASNRVIIARPAIARWGSLPRPRVEEVEVPTGGHRAVARP